MKSTRLLNALDSFQSYQSLKKDMEDIFTQVTLDPVKDKVEIAYIKREIACFVSSMEIEQEDFNKVCGFDVDLETIDQRDLYDSLKELQEEEKYLSGMAAAWESDDACEAACNDPGLQYEQGEKVEQLWADFENNYNKTN
jgi:hypothetical protein